MKKTIIGIIIIFLSGLKLFSQNTYTVDKFNISFETTEKLEFSLVETENVASFENDNVAVDIEIIPIEQESKKFRKNLKKGAKEIAKDFGLKKIKDGGKLLKVDNGYYVKGLDFDEGTKYPVIIIAALNYDKGIAYEISIDCYNLNETESNRIINSIKLVK
ncbi:hypothetical protein DFQ10_108131 [Winogradskyella eximia]|uniref:PsbP protein n=1 Tax=Winogradskyella eximia TaxID=262006 RepID=A0A3D9GZN9_9FLAO|nr:hypothetical protein DFQ10_108131 [Winogradskyella eximia]